MENEIKQDFLSELEKNLEKDLNNLENENKKELAKHKETVIESVKKELAELERKNEENIKKTEAKLKNFYYWLFGVALVFLLIIIGVTFYLRSLSLKTY